MPPRYQRSFSFAGFQANQPKASLPGQRLDIELDAIAASVARAGASAYDLAKLSGFVGSEADYLASLIGPPGAGLVIKGSIASLAALPVVATVGDAYTVTTTSTTPPVYAALDALVFVGFGKGTHGPGSSYQNIGSLQGPAGKDGLPGTPGIPGTPGKDGAAGPAGPTPDTSLFLQKTGDGGGLSIKETGANVARFLADALASKLSATGDGGGLTVKETGASASKTLSDAMAGKLGTAGGTITGQLISVIPITNDNPGFNFNFTQTGLKAFVHQFCNLTISNVVNPNDTFNREALSGFMRVTGGKNGSYYVGGQRNAESLSGGGEVFGGNDVGHAGPNADPGMLCAGSECNTWVERDIRHKAGLHITDVLGSIGRGTGAQGNDAGLLVFRQYQANPNGGAPRPGLDTSRGYEQAIQLGFLVPEAVFQFPGVSSGICFGYGNPFVGIDMLRVAPVSGVGLSLRANQTSLAFTTASGGTLGNAGSVSSLVAVAGGGANIIFADGQKLTVYNAAKNAAIEFDMQNYTTNLSIEGAIARVKKGAAGSGPGGVGRALYIDN